jgi:hypothetical protein
MRRVITLSVHYVKPLDRYEISIETNDGLIYIRLYKTDSMRSLSNFIARAIEFLESIELEKEVTKIACN